MHRNFIFARSMVGWLLDGFLNGFWEGGRWRERLGCRSYLPYLGMMSGQERAMAIHRSPQRDMCQNVGIRNSKVSLDQAKQR